MKLIAALLLCLCLYSCTAVGNNIRGDIVKDIEAPIQSDNTISPFDAISVTPYDFPDTVEFINDKNGVIFDGNDEFSYFVDKFLNSIICGDFTKTDTFPHTFGILGAQDAFYTRFELTNRQNNGLSPIKKSNNAYYAVTICTRAKFDKAYSNVYSLWLLEVAKDERNGIYVKSFELQDF